MDTLLTRLKGLGDILGGEVRVSSGLISPVLSLILLGGDLLEEIGHSFARRAGQAERVDKGQGLLSGPMEDDAALREEEEVIVNIIRLCKRWRV